MSQCDGLTKNPSNHCFHSRLEGDILEAKGHNFAVSSMETLNGTILDKEYNFSPQKTIDIKLLFLYFF